MIDLVYRTVLSALNKEQRGYLTPTEFNEFAYQAQVEIYESYFYSLARAIATYGTMEVAFENIPDHLMEKLENFRSVATLNVDGGAVALPEDLYRLGEVFLGQVLVDRVSHSQIRYVVNSPLTYPSERQPVYTRTGNTLTIYPQQTSRVRVEYIRALSSTPKWVGTTLNGQLIYNQQDSIDFELDFSEEPELVAKILAYAGVSVRSAEVTQAASQKDQQLTQSEQ